jgi:hypothetical protein
MNKTERNKTIKQKSKSKSKHNKTQRNISKTIKNKTLKGGLFLRESENSELLFNDFLNNTKKIEYIADGANGIIYKLTVPERYKGGYTYVDPNYYGEPVREIALKLCVLENKDIPNFKSEVNIQTDIFKKTISFLQPICPAILFSKVLNDKEKRELLYKMLKIDKNIKKHMLPFNDTELDIQNQLLTNSRLRLGIIAMEFEKDYKRLYDFIKSEKVSREMKIKYINYSLYIILKLALETGYSQADFHTANIMIHPSMDYFSEKGGRPLILDFGYSVKIPSYSMKKIQLSVRNGDYISALKWICGAKRSDNNTLIKESWSSYYGWVCRDWDLLKNMTNPKSVGNAQIAVGEDTFKYPIPKNIAYSNNNKIRELFNLRETYKKKIMNEFNKLYKKSPLFYPEIPLSDKIIKEHTYNGLRG